MKPMPNESFWIKFSNFFEILKFRPFLHVLYLFEHRVDPDFRKLSKISKIDGFWDRFGGYQVYFFENFFRENFSMLPSPENVHARFCLFTIVQKLRLKT